jgi:hypothetical protein
VPDFNIAGPSPIAASDPFPSTDPDVSSTSLAAVTNVSLRRTPSFGSDFGGFNDGAAWGGSEWKKDGWGDASGGAGAARMSMSRSPSPAAGYTDTYDDQWGGVRAGPEPAPEPTAQELDWAAAQRSMKIKEVRAPYDRVENLKRGWDDVALKVIPESDRLEAPDEASEAKLADGVRDLDSHVSETLRALTELPDTRIPPLHTLATHQKYTAALSRATVDPGTSLLHMPLRPRRLEGLAFGPGLESMWGGRSRLGEPDAEAAAAAVAEEAPSRWNFWRKNTPQHRPLVTSGGGVLEVKTPSAPPTPSLPEPVVAAAAAATTAAAVTTTAAAAAAAAAAATATASVSTSRLSISSAPRTSTSRPSSPAVLPPTFTPPIAEQGHASPRHSLGDADTGASAVAAAPTGVSRFWRWGRRPPAPEATVATETDIELTTDDFAFLNDVPSIPTPRELGTGDLLGFGAPPTVENVLGAAKAAPLPQPLAAPPRAGPRAPPLRQGSFVARMATTNATNAARHTPQPSAMDLLSGLDFDAPAAPQAASSSASASRPTSVSWDNWEDLLAPSAPSASSSARATPPIAPLAPPPAPARLATPPVIAPPPTSTPPVLTARPISTSPIPFIPSRTSSVSPTAASMSMAPLAATLPPISTAKQAQTQSSTSPAPFSWDSPTSTLTPSAPLMPTAAAVRKSLSIDPALHVPGTSSVPLSGTESPGSANPLLGLTPSTGTTATLTPTPKPGPTRSGLGTPLNLSVNAPASANDDFGDFGDFSSFSSAPPAAAGDDDDFGDFGDFASFSTAPPVPNKASAAAGAKTPLRLAPFGAASTASSPAPTPPSKSPYTPAGRNFAYGHLRGASTASASQGLLDSPTRRVDHTPTIELLGAAAKSGAAWPTSPQTPMSPHVPSPLPSPTPAPLGALPPPPGGGGRKKPVVNLLDFDDL